MSGNDDKRNQKQWRLIDTGILRAAENISINKAMLAAHQNGEVPHTLRFLQFEPSALLGYHQSARQELRLDYCKANNVDVQRRITGGGAIYFDQTQIGWELYFDKKFIGTDNMAEVSRLICIAAAKGISDLGVDARFRPRNDIEVDGRKISGTGGAMDGESVLYQGSLLIQFDVEKMLQVLRIPAEKLTDKAIASARERVINLADLLGYIPTISEVKSKMASAFSKAFGLEFDEQSALSDSEVTRYNRALQEIDTDQWINLVRRPENEAEERTAIYRCSGGTLYVSVFIDKQRKRIKQVWITGDVFISPKRTIVDLEAVLRNTQIVLMKEIIEQFFKLRDTHMHSLTAIDFYTAIKSAVEAEPKLG